MLLYRSKEKTMEEFRQKARESQTRTATKTKKTLSLSQKTKRILKVYETQGHFFIEHVAAYSLGLTQVRSVMTDTIKLFEINKEQLSEFMKNDTLEIHFEKTDAQETTKDNSAEEQLREALRKLPPNKYGIGVHSISSGTDEQKEETTSDILKSGLNLPPRSQTILSTAISLGENQDSDTIAQEVIDYYYGQGKKANVVLAIPEVIQSSTGEKIFLGFPERNKKTSAQQYDAHCILDRICACLHLIPKEFILGYYSETSTGEKSFIPNTTHISQLTPVQIDELFSLLSSGMDFVTKKFNDSVSQRKISEIEQARDTWQKNGTPTPLFDSLIHLSQKYSTQKRPILLDER